MRLIYYLILTAFIAVAVFGFVAISQNADFAACAESVVNTNRCNNTNELAMGIVHADVFMSFVLTILSVIFIFFAAISQRHSLVKCESNVGRQNYFSVSEFFYTFSKKIIDWLGLLERRTGTHLS